MWATLLIDKNWFCYRAHRIDGRLSLYMKIEILHLGVRTMEGNNF